MRPTLALAALVLATACQTTPGPDAAPGADPAGCGADRLQPYLGGPVAAAQQAAGQSITRVYEEGDVITMDYLPARVNIVTDGAGQVVRIACG